MMVAVPKAVVFLSLWLSVCLVGGSYIPPEMNRTIQNLLQHYKIPQKERFNGKPVFSKEPLSGKMEAKRLFMGGVLETYEKLIGHMLNQLPTASPQKVGTNDVFATAATAAAGEDVRVELSSILTKVTELRKRRFQEQEKLLQGLKALRNIQMDNLVVQSKALWELPWLYEEASSLSDPVKQERRRRRHARRVRGHPRA